MVQTSSMLRENNFKFNQLLGSLKKFASLNHLVLRKDIRVIDLYRFSVINR